MKYRVLNYHVLNDGTLALRYAFFNDNGYLGMHIANIERTILDSQIKAETLLGMVKRTFADDKSCEFIEVSYDTINWVILGFIDDLDAMNDM